MVNVGPLKRLRPVGEFGAPQQI